MFLFSALSSFFPPRQAYGSRTGYFDLNLLFQLCFVSFPRFFGYLSHTDNHFGRVYFVSLFSSIDMDTVVEGIRKESKEKPRDFLSTAVRDSTAQHPPDDSLSRAAADDDEEDDDEVKERQLASSVIRSSNTKARARETLRTEARAPDHRAE